MSYLIQPLPDELRERAVAHLRHELHPDTLAQVRELRAENPEKWWAMHHMFFGMSIRNLLRRAIKDEELPDNGIGPNWDDYYVQVLEEAADDHTEV